MNAPAPMPVLMALQAALSVALLTVGAERADAGEFNKTQPAEPRGEVEIVNVAGEVEVQGWERSEIQVEAELGNNIERVDFKRDGQRTYIKVMQRNRGGSAGATDLIVRIPRDSSLTVNTVSADQRIIGVRGAQRLQAVSGGIETDFGPAELELKTVSGSITARGLRGGKSGSLRATSVSGDMQLDDLGREIDLNTVSGDMNVRLDRLDRGRIKTTNGDLDITTALGDEVRLDAEAINGDLRFNLRGSISAEFDIETFNGDIENCFGPHPSRTREYGPGNELRFTQGKGDGRVRIKTLNGSVTLCKR